MDYMCHQFTLTVWNTLEDLGLCDQFVGTKKGMIQEIHEYAQILQSEFQKQYRTSDEGEYIRFCIHRDLQKT